jgi:hypothetical protein
MNQLPTSRPRMLGDPRSPGPQAAMPIWGHEPPDPHGTGIGPGSRLPAEAPGTPGCPGGRRPLPDPVAVRLCRIPDPAPPYDEEAGRKPGNRSAQDTPKPASPGRPVVPSAPRPASSAGWPSRFAQVLAETLAGSRPPGQMAPWTTEMARRHIKRLGPELASAQRPRVRRVVTFHPSSDVMEMTVVVGFGPRVRALAVRLERTGADARTRGRQPESPRWLCTAVEAA